LTPARLVVVRLFCAHSHTCKAEVWPRSGFVTRGRRLAGLPCLLVRFFGLRVALGVVLVGAPGLAAGALRARAEVAQFARAVVVPAGAPAFVDLAVAVGIALRVPVARRPVAGLGIAGRRGAVLTAGAEFFLAVVGGIERRILASACAALHVLVAGGPLGPGRRTLAFMATVGCGRHRVRPALAGAASCVRAGLRVFVALVHRIAPWFVPMRGALQDVHGHGLELGKSGVPVGT